MNRVDLIGIVTRDPDLKEYPDMKVAAFTLAVRRGFKGKNGEYGTDFVPCRAFGVVAGLIGTRIKKGSKIAVMGDIRVDTYTKNEERRKSIYIQASAINFLDVKGKSGDGGAESSGDYGADNFNDDFDDADLAF
jgi:single-strand DNA-binding protein